MPIAKFLMINLKPSAFMLQTCKISHAISQCAQTIALKSLVISVAFNDERYSYIKRKSNDGHIAINYNVLSNKWKQCLF